MDRHIQCLRRYLNRFERSAESWADADPNFPPTLTAAQQKIDQLVKQDAYRLASESQRLIASGNDVELATLLAIRASRTLPTDLQLQLDLRQALSANYIRLGPLDFTPLAYTPDGKFIIDNTFQMHDAKSFAVVGKSSVPQDTAYYTDLSPDARLTFLQHPSSPIQVDIWDIQTGKIIQTVPGMGQAFSSDSQHILTHDQNYIFHLWDIASGHLVQTFNPQNQDSSISTIFSPDDRYLITAHSSASIGGITIWNVASGSKVAAPILPSGSTLSQDNTSGLMTVSPDSKTLMVATSQGIAVDLFDLATGANVGRVAAATTDVDPRLLTNVLYSLIFTPDGRYLFGADEFDQTYVWDWKTGDLLTKLKPGGNPVFAPDGQTFLMGGRKWTMPAMPRSYDSRFATTTLVSPDGNYLVGSGTVNNVHTGDILYYDPPGAFGISPDSRYIIGAGPNGGLGYYNIATGQLAYELAPYGNQTPYSIGLRALSPDGKWLLFGSSHNSAWLVNAATGVAVYNLAGQISDAVGAAFSPDSRYAAIATDQAVQVWDVATGAPLFSIVDPTGIKGFTFSPDGQYILTTNKTVASKLWAVPSKLSPKVTPISTYLPQYTITPTFTLTPYKSPTPTTSVTMVFYPTPTFDISPTAIPPSETLQANFAPLYSVITTPIRTIGAGSEGGQALFTPDGKYVITRRGQLVEVWDFASGLLLTTRTIGRYDDTTQPDQINNVTVAGQYLYALSQKMDDPRQPGDIYAVPYPSGIRPEIADVKPADLLNYACQHVFRDLSDDERTRFYISDSAATCP